MAKITIKDVIDVSILKKMVHLHNKEANVKTFIVALSNTYDEKFETALNKSLKNKTNAMLSETNDISAEPKKSNMERMKELAKETTKASRALFSEETTRRVLNKKAE